MDQSHAGSDDQQGVDAMDALAISVGPPLNHGSERENQGSDDQQGVEAIDALPISVGPPLNHGSERENQENVPTGVSKLCPLTIQERQQGWIQQPRTRTNGGQTDNYHYHLQTQKMCRTMLEAYYFIATGVLARRTAEVMKEAIAARLGYPLARIGRNTLIQPKVVGSYNVKTNEVTRMTTTQYVEAFLRESYQNLMNSGLKKRKREECHNDSSNSSLQQSESSQGDEVPSEEDEIALYDYELNF